MCGKGGASIGCFDDDCPWTYHYLCAKEDDAQFLPNFDFYCKDHKVNDETNEVENPEEN